MPVSGSAGANLNPTLADQDAGPTDPGIRDNALAFLRPYLKQTGASQFHPLYNSPVEYAL